MPKIINKVRKKIKRKEKESLLEDEKKCNFNGLATLGP